VGKTTIAKILTDKLNAEYINLTNYAKTHNLTLDEDKERQTTIINEKSMRQELKKTIQDSTKQTIIIDGHYAPAVTPGELVNNVFVLRRNPKELKIFMQKRGYRGTKLWENLSAEILDSCLIEAVQTQKGKVCEIDATSKTAAEVTAEILDVLSTPEKCCLGFVDWLGILEKEGLTDNYLRA
jgi:adenylate kinase